MRGSSWRRRGLSPRVRGNPMAKGGNAVSRRSIPARTGGTDHIRTWTNPGRRSIPARTGEPVPQRAVSHVAKVYPRAYGGTAAFAFRRACENGLSPRVRGNPAICRLSMSCSRSIPARTGEPSHSRHLPIRDAVYPRAYGGTQRLARLCRQHGGLSPRVRGNQPRDTGLGPLLGSIPARTGEPTAISESGDAPYGLSPARTGEPLWVNGTLYTIKVYPRAYGGTRRRNSGSRHRQGLSPRVRGNRQVETVRPPGRGSIPARTGEPYPTGPRLRQVPVYPRAYGGTRTVPSYQSRLYGLSPRVRGNRRLGSRNRPGRRSIPARTGEPSRPAARGDRAAVYPRAYGGTRREVRPGQAGRGLSPRVRGEPARPMLETVRHGVYPRAYGGTALCFLQPGGVAGLSPRVRGNHAQPRERAAC